MRVNQISLYNVQNSHIQTRKNFGIIQDSVSFTSNVETEKKGFLERLFGKFFTEKELTPEVEKSEEIKDVIFGLKKQADDFKKGAKYDKKIAKEYLKIGKLSNFQTTPLRNNEKILYGEINPDTNLPKTITILDFSNGMNVKKAYSIPEGTDSLITVDYMADDTTDVTVNLFGSVALSVSERDRDTLEKRTLMPTKGGFYYISGLSNEKGEIVNRSFEINFDKANPNDSFYRELGEDGKLHTYKYNTELDLWELESRE